MRLFYLKQNLKNQHKPIPIPIPIIMNSLRLTIFYLLPFTLLFHIAYCVDPLYHLCSNSGNYTANSPFENNLNMLRGYLSSRAPPIGFELKSMGQGEDTVHGLVLCRGDVGRADCKSCIVEAGNEILERCPNNRGASIWYDNCLLRYSNQKFFGKIDSENRFYRYNFRKGSRIESFNQKTEELISQLTNRAYISPLLFATGELKLGETEKLYGLVQCTKDLSGIQCKKCLDDVTSELGRCCDGKKGGRVVSGSCNLRYELYPFVNS